MDLLEIDILGNSINDHWYYQSKAKVLQKLIGNHQHQVLLDVGAGSAFFTKWLLTNTNIQEAWCVDNSYPFDKD